MKKSKLKVVSVITPCLNIISAGREEYFHKMMHGVHEQSYRNLEHIVVDGCSTDGTLAILFRYQGMGWIDNLIVGKDSGIYSAMNKGIRLAHGRYINIMNTDDYLTKPDYFSQCVSLIETQGINFVHADRLIHSPDGLDSYVKKGNERTMAFRMPFRHQTMVIKKSIFDLIGNFDETYKIAADYKFVLKMLLAGVRGQYIPQTVLISLGGGASANREQCVKEVGRVLYECYGKENGLTFTDCRNIYTRRLSKSLIFKISTITDQKIKNSLQYLINNQ
ncbi:MAG TPA: glycosyltransferase family 2 protein [Patescibacteria group bacterium]|nr:glycosyltransferase family 2 protein [Patescibacteria group bacterium]